MGGCNGLRLRHNGSSRYHPAMPPGPIAQQLLPEDKESLLEWLSKGETLNDWMRGPGSGYSRRLVYYRVAVDPELDAAFRVSRQAGADEIADDIRALMYAEPERITDQNGITRIDPAYVALIKARADVDLRLLAKWNSNKYGERIEHKIDTPPAGPGLTIIVQQQAPAIVGQQSTYVEITLPPPQPRLEQA